MPFDASAHRCSRLNSAQITLVGEVNLDGSFNEAGRGNSIFCLSSAQPARRLRGPDAEPVTDLDPGAAESADLKALAHLEADAIKAEQNLLQTGCHPSSHGHHLL